MCEDQLGCARFVGYSSKRAFLDTRSDTKEQLVVDEFDKVQRAVVVSTRIAVLTLQRAILYEYSMS